MRRKSFIFIVGFMLFTACGTQDKKNIEEVVPVEYKEIVFPEKPSRKPYEGFKWEEKYGAGIRFWAQTNGKTRVVTDASLPGARIARVDSDGKEVLSDAVIRLLPLDGGKIESLMPVIRKEPCTPSAKPWKEKETCAFKEVESKREGVRRYILVPTDKYAGEIARRGKHMPIPSICGGWGVGNSGMRYFEVFDARPDCAVFVEIGQDVPLFDEMSIQPYDKQQTVKGKLVIGHEARSFVADSDSIYYWVKDRTGQLKAKYDSIVGENSKPYTPISVELKVNVLGPTTEGFAAEYAGIYEVLDIIQANK